MRAILDDAVGGLRRNGLMAAAATTTMAIALTVAGAGFVLSANLTHLATILESQVEVVGFLRRGLSPARHQQILEAVRALPDVRRATFVSKDDALRRLQQTYGSMASVRSLLPGNPLPDSIEVRAADAGRVRAVAEALGRTDGIEEVVYGAPVVERLVALTRAVRIAGGALAALLVASALLIIANTIRLTIAARRQEIEIMTLVGATAGFIRGPFLVEGALQGIAAALLASVLLVVAYTGLTSAASTSLPFLPLLPAAAVVPQTIGLVWLLSLAVGVGGSAIALRRYLAT
ncbi:MAG: permease-like cell division protein FtsX [Armatimonadota bacterium]|nr:permease-like cell division protein FtsX [Armatimonadota bacterium]